MKWLKFDGSPLLVNELRRAEWGENDNYHFCR
jgi:hypothetical protein